MGELFATSWKGNMATMIKTFGRHVWESIKSLKRNGWMTIASVSAVTITLILVGVFLGIIMNVTKLASDIENDVNVTVFVDIGTKKNEIDKLQKKLQNLGHVKKVTFSSNCEQLKKIKDSMGDAWELFEGDSNPLYDVLIVSTDNPNKTKSVSKKAAKLKSVYKADYGGISSDKLIAIMKNVQTWGFGVAFLLLFVAIFLISNTIRITILSRQVEIEIMRLVGAQNSFIRWPFFFEGAWIGMVGSTIPVFLIYVTYRTIYRALNPELLSANYALIRPIVFIPKISILVSAIGILIGSFGSVIAMRRFLKL